MMHFSQRPAAEQRPPCRLCAGGSGQGSAVLIGVVREAGAQVSHDDLGRQRCDTGFRGRGGDVQSKRRGVGAVDDCAQVWMRITRVAGVVL